MKKKGLRKGFTTGACAAAAAKGAVTALVEQTIGIETDITLPTSQKVCFQLTKCHFTTTNASCSVIKDAGDDPDVTNKAEIKADVQLQLLQADNMSVHESIEVIGGEGVGTVTKPGLPVAVGKSAINPVPEKMIKDAVAEVMTETKGKLFFNNRGLRVTVVVPKGRRIAKKTMNERLGIVDGISILGTTGIVEPMSLKAYCSTIETGIDIARGAMLTELILTPGRNSEKQAETLLPRPEEAFVQMGDHVGHALQSAVEKGVTSIIVVGRLGKLSKIAMGHFQTHAYQSSIDFDIMARWADELGYDSRFSDQVKAANTMAEVATLFKKGSDVRIFSLVARKVVDESRRFVHNRASLRCILLSTEGEVYADES